MLKLSMAIITIGGNIGAGKTTLAGRLTKALGYGEFSMSRLFRDMAAERTMTLEDFYADIRKYPALERGVDERQMRLMREKDDFIVQGRVAWYFAKESSFAVLNIILTVDPATGAERTARREENAGKTVEELIRANALRVSQERERYKMLYEIENFLDPGHYDFALDTSHLDETEVFQGVLSKAKEMLEADI